jgi:hypothetical protein
VLGLFCGMILAFFWHSLRSDGIEKGEAGEGMP